MPLKTTTVGSLIFLGLVLLSLGGMAHAQEGKQVMIVFTTDTNGEVNPCG
jgi:hypothetical protein